MGYSDEFNTWEPQCNLGEDARFFIDDFRERLPMPGSE